MRRSLELLFLLALLAGCSKDGVDELPPQQWRQLNIAVQTHPAPVAVGMNEFVVIVSQRGVRPRYDYLVSIRTDSSDPWKQTIQDGEIGVFRRALLVRPGQSMLQVRIKYNKEEGILHFPLYQHPRSATNG